MLGAEDPATAQARRGPRGAGDNVAWSPQTTEEQSVTSEQDALPGVSYVMPVLNEVDYIESAIDSILDQDYPGATEIVLALGPSTDGTDDAVARLAARDPRIHTVANPRAAIPSGLNLAIAASVHPVIVRVDAHTQLPAGYTRRAVETLLRVNADNVGGVMSAVGRPGLQQAIATAYNSRLGLGGGAYHSADETEGPAESAYLGVMRASALADIGGFDESLQRGEDWEMNFRMREAGHLVWLDPALRVTYWPRSSWAALAKQFLATGIWRGELVRRMRGRHPVRYYAPPALVVAAAASIVLVPLGVVVGGRLRWLGAAAGTVDLLYLAVLVGAAAREPGSFFDRGRYAGVLATMHLSWGFGMLRGLSHGGQVQHVDRSRHV
jgi:succinoglycan biosynthesis protein ExoA